MSPKTKRRIVTALVISLVLHTGFLVWSYFLKILPAMPFPETPEAVFHVKIDRREYTGSSEKLQFDRETSSKVLKAINPFVENTARRPSIESEEVVKNNIESSIQRNKEAMIPASVQENQLLRKAEFNDIITTKKVRRAIRENLVELGQVPSENFSSGTPVLISGEDISRNFLDKSAIPANMSRAAPVQAANAQSEFKMMKMIAPGPEHQSKSIDLGTALTYQLFKYRDPSGRKYFKLIVKVRDATINFPVIPKEMIYLLDASGSIGMRRLNQFEDGIIYSLKHLNPHDRFNILVFKNKTISLSPVSLDPSPDNIKKAVDFLEDLKSWSTTDLYNALLTSIDMKDPFVPSYRVVMTDGFPTTGIVDTLHVIDQISRINQDRVSIFTFGGGTSVDPYMLDFIAFKNRGWSTVVGREYQIGREFDRFYNEIRDPLLLNMRYYASGLDESQIFPQSMPDFFKGSQFVIWGRYTSENKFAVQIRGNIAHEEKEFVVSASLSDAMPGDKQIAWDWAFHKVYYLISQLKYQHNNAALIQAINDLCDRYHIITPYSFSYQKPATAVKPQTQIKKKSP